jgi:hypothetical protein
VADRDVTLEPVERLLREHLGDEAHVPEDGEAPVVGDGDPRGFLSAVLEREQSEVGDARDVALGRPDPEHAAHLDGAHLLRELGNLRPGEHEADGVVIRCVLGK